MPEKVVQRVVVTINYLLNDENCKYRKIPVSYPHDSGVEMFPKVEQALPGKSVGDQVNISLNPDESFGQHYPSLVFTDAHYQCT